MKAKNNNVDEFVENKTVNINVNDGLQRVTINSDPSRAFAWNPADLNFVDRFMVFQLYVEGIPDRLKEIKGLDKVKLDENGEPIIELDENGEPVDMLKDYEIGSLEKLGKEFNAELNKTFGSDVSTPFFGKVNPLSPQKNGNFLYENLLNAVMPLIEDSFSGFEESRKKYVEGSRNRAQRRAAQRQATSKSGAGRK